MSSKRPGTVDYSKWDNLEDSSSDEEDTFGRASGGPPSRPVDAGRPAPKRSSGTTARSAEPPPPKRRPPLPHLSVLQKAWGNEDEGLGKNKGKPEDQCIVCGALSPPYKCSRCQVAWYCNVACQRAYHPIHRLECIDASKHFAFWGFLNSNKNEKSSSVNDSKKYDHKTQLLAIYNRQMARRRRTLKQAAAAARVERARLAREAAAGGDNKGKGKEAAAEKEETCVICQCEFAVSVNIGAGSLSCPGSHFMCGECTGVYVKSVLSDLETSYPPRCSMCRTEFSQEHFERQLTSKQQVEVKTHAARLTLKPGQKLVKCAECDYFEITSADPVVWWCAACEKGTCFVCNKDLPRGVQKYDLDKSPHAVCKALRHAKALVDAAIESGSKMNCPGCGLSGRKDDACTHMTCPKCTTVWCYVCGKAVKDCDKASPRSEEAPVDDIYLHNQGWETNEARCPMYLTQILEVDLGWLGENWEQEATNEDFDDDEKCLDYFHRFQSIRKLQEVRESIGAGTFEAVFQNFDSVKNSGYTLDEIVSTSTERLIDREDFIRYRTENDEQIETAAQNMEAEETGGGGDDDDDEMEEVWQEVPEQMTRATMMEEQQMREAIGRSEASMQEDAALRHALEASLAGKESGEGGEI